VKRREFITLLGGAAAGWPLAARAQSPKMLRVGYSGMLPREAPHYAAFEKRMAELGYQEGRNFTFEYIQAPNIEGYELTYRELAARNVDILLAAGNEPALRAARAAGTTPIVFIALDFDPVEKGYVASLSRPGSNSTGLFVSQLLPISSISITPAIGRSQRLRASVAKPGASQLGREARPGRPAAPFLPSGPATSFPQFAKGIVSHGRPQSS
jgi:hypothetical protein